MKFYREKNNSYFWDKIKDNKLTSIYQFIFDNNKKCTHFFKNSVRTNSKNSAVIKNDGTKKFMLNGIYYGDEKIFTKQSWRKFIKLQVFK